LLRKRAGKEAERVQERVKKWWFNLGDWHRARNANRKGRRRARVRMRTKDMENE